MKNQQLRLLWVMVATSLVIIAMWTGWMGVLMLALVATFLTVGLRTGSLAPHFPTVTRSQRPVVFWLVMAFCAAVLFSNLFFLFRRL